MCWALSDGSSKLIPIDEQPITRSCICSVLEKQIVRRINRFAQFIAICSNENASCKFSCDRGGQDGKLSYHIFGEIQKHFAGGERMAKIKITIQDDFGKVITETADREYQLDLGKATLTEIEGAVEDFKKRALADIEKDFLHDAQTRFVKEQKKEEWSSVMGQQQSLSRHYTASFPLPSND